MMYKDNQYHGSGHMTNLTNLKNKSLKSDGKEASKNYTSKWVNTEEKSLVQLIVETFVDSEKKKILNHASERPLTKYEMVEICKMPVSSGYRAINTLIKRGLLVKSSVDKIKNGRKINKYQSIFENVKINIEKNKISVLVKFAKT